jgi:hypothetical protein
MEMGGVLNHPKDITKDFSFMAENFSSRGHFFEFILIA